VRALTLLYHDVVEPDDFTASGFPGADADSYKMDVGRFAAHVAAIDRATPHKPVSAFRLLQQASAEPVRLITFDDGGVSAYTHIASLLEKQGWPGHFFVTTNRIGSPTFLTREQIRSLRERGHIIGSHSVSHPVRMSACGWDVLLNEWSNSRRALSDILGEDVTVASVPGGYFSKTVALAASAAGIRLLFTSEPTARCHVVDECLVVGRYCLRRGSPAVRAAQLLRGERLPRVSSWLSWNTRKAAKRIGGDIYLRARLSLLR
jgi:peptidoglycan/xylan/chitin deacetylase (PgdA/CDA1 family)